MRKPSFPTTFFIYPFLEVIGIEKHKCKAKFHNRKIICASEILCEDCPERDKCQDIDLYIEGKYQGVKNCMTRNSYKKEKGKIKQKTWGK